MLATYRSYRGCWTSSRAICGQPTGLMKRCWTASGAVCWQPAGLRGCWTASGAVCWQPTGPIEVAEPLLGLHVANLQVLWRLLNRLWGCMLTTYRSYRGCWTASGALFWQPTRLMEAPLGLYVDNIQVLWRLLNRLWGCMLATYRSYRGCRTASGAVCC